MWYLIVSIPDFCTVTYFYLQTFIIILTVVMRVIISNVLWVFDFVFYLQTFGIILSFVMRTIISNILSVFDFVFYLQTFGIILFIGMRAIISHVIGIFFCLLPADVWYYSIYWYECH